MCSILKRIEVCSTAEEVTNSSELAYDSQSVRSALAQNDFYKKGYAKYVLVKLEYLYSGRATQRKITAASIEHVLPQHPEPNSEWKQKFSEQELLDWTHNIANLVLLSKRKNTSASNLDFQQKIEQYFKGRISDLPRSLEMMREEEWTVAILERRLGDILKLMCP